MLPIRTVLHPTDFSEPSRFAFELACSVARGYGAQLIICHVMHPPIPQYGEGVVALVPDGYEEELGARLLRIHPPASIPVMHLLEIGQPVAEIVRVAKEANAELIVMGAHGKHSQRRQFMGSVAERVMREAPCPVLTVKMPMTHAAPHEFYCLTSADERKMPAFAKTALFE